ncbi:magnesium/cobalt transporter CorA [Acetonema longum]|uniref:magnesium/cobalt transporter CorA n=1 Tax=Acetonema longum TaxID=2374 RepID=UPI0039B727AD
MARLRSEKPKNRMARQIGLPPGSLLHMDLERDAKSKITLFHYDEANLVRRECMLSQELAPPLPEGITWIHVTGTLNLPLIERLGEVFSLHPLVLEDIVSSEQRPKSEDFGEYYFIVTKIYMLEGRRIVTGQASFILGGHYVISFLEEDSGLFAPVIERLTHPKGKMRKLGADYLVYALIDTIVDHYFCVLEQFGDDIERLEEAVVSQASQDNLQEIHDLKTQMLVFRKAVWPLREMISTLERGQSGLFREPTQLYIRDVYDHITQVLDTLETYRDVALGLLDMYISGASNRMNQIIKVLTIISTIFMPLTFIVGLYGMNFRHMPELEWNWGYPAVLLVMGTIAGGMLWYFKRKGWI